MALVPLKRVFLGVAVLGLFLYQSAAGEGGKFEWPKASAESQGFSGEKLDKLKDVLAKKRTKTFINGLPIISGREEYGAPLRWQRR